MSGVGRAKGSWRLIIESEKKSNLFLIPPAQIHLPADLDSTAMAFLLVCDHRYMSLSCPWACEKGAVSQSFLQWSGLLHQSCCPLSGSSGGRGGSWRGFLASGGGACSALGWPLRSFMALGWFRWGLKNTGTVLSGLHISGLTKEGEWGGGGHTYSYGGDGPRTARTLPSNISSPNSDSLCNK